MTSDAGVSAARTATGRIFLVGLPVAVVIDAIAQRVVRCGKQGCASVAEGPVVALQLAGRDTCANTAMCRRGNVVVVRRSIAVIVDAVACRIRWQRGGIRRSAR